MEIIQQPEKQIELEEEEVKASPLNEPSEHREKTVIAEPTKE